MRPLKSKTAAPSAANVARLLLRKTVDVIMRFSLHADTETTTTTTTTTNTKVATLHTA